MGSSTHAHAWQWQEPSNRLSCQCVLKDRILVFLSCANMTALGAPGLIQALEKYLAAREMTGAYRTCPVCVRNFYSVAFSNQLKGNNFNCKLFPSIAEHFTKEKISVQGYYYTPGLWRCCS